VKRNRGTLLVVVAILSGAVGLVGAFGALGRIRAVDIVQIFFGGAGAGVGVVAAVSEARRRKPNIFPALKYQNAPAAMEWLGRAFDLRTRRQMAGPDGSIAHAELQLGPGFVMLGSLGKPDARNPWSTEPGVYVYVPDVAAHYARALAAGAAIVRALHDTSYGAREYSARDLEGKLWSFGTYHPES
jgi:uncharacterized glyoxalase superfamily protein PhnB